MKPIKLFENVDRESGYEEYEKFKKLYNFLNFFADKIIMRHGDIPIIELYFKTNGKDPQPALDYLKQIINDFSSLIGYSLLNPKKLTLDKLKKHLVIDIHHIYDDKWLMLSVLIYNEKTYKIRLKIIEEIEKQYHDYLFDASLYNYALIDKEKGYKIYGNEVNEWEREKFKIKRLRKVIIDINNGYNRLRQKWGSNFYDEFVKYANRIKILRELKKILMQKGLIDSNFNLQKGKHFYEVKKATEVFFKGKLRRIHICPVCGKVFTSNRSHQFLCSQNCRRYKSMVIKPALTNIYNKVRSNIRDYDDAYIEFFRQAELWQKEREQKHKNGRKVKQIFDIERIASVIWQELEKENN